jgi:ketosteroid isomerase-like protein
MDRHPSIERIRWLAGGLIALATVLGGGSVDAGESPESSLRAVEEAFAAAMTDRDLDAFASFLDPETVFFNGPEELRGKQAVVAAWAPFFEGEQPPFAWRPEVVSVLSSGDLGLTSGPVRAPDGNRIGTFNSIWRKNPEGEWKIVFDRGCP